MNYKKYIEELQEKLKTAGDVKSALTEEYQSLIALQNKMLDDIKKKSFPMEAYMQYFKPEQVTPCWKAEKKRNRKQNNFMKIYFLVIIVGLFAALPEVLWGMLVALAVFLIYKRRDDLQRKTYRDLCRDEIAKLSKDCKNLEEKIKYYDELENTIQKAIHEIHYAAALNPLTEPNLERLDNIVQEFAPKLVFAYPKNTEH